MIDMQATEGEHSELELDPLGTLVWPMKLAEQRSDAVQLPC